MLTHILQSVLLLCSLFILCITLCLEQTIHKQTKQKKKKDTAVLHLKDQEKFKFLVVYLSLHTVDNCLKHRFCKASFIAELLQKSKSKKASKKGQAKENPRGKKGNTKLRTKTRSYGEQRGNNEGTQRTQEDQGTGTETQEMQQTHKKNRQTDKQ